MSDPFRTLPGAERAVLDDPKATSADVDAYLRSVLPPPRPDPPGTSGSTDSALRQAASTPPTRPANNLHEAVRRAANRGRFAG